MEPENKPTVKDAIRVAGRRIRELMAEQKAERLQKDAVIAELLKMADQREQERRELQEIAIDLRDRLDVLGAQLYTAREANKEAEQEFLKELAAKNALQEQVDRLKSLDAKYNAIIESLLSQRRRAFGLFKRPAAMKIIEALIQKEVGRSEDEERIWKAIKGPGGTEPL